MSGPAPSTSTTSAAISDTRSPAQDIHHQQPPADNNLPSHTPVEMSTLPPTSNLTQDQHDTDTSPATKTTSADSSVQPLGPQRTDTHTAINQSLHPHPPPPSPPVLSDHPPVTRTFSTAIGPSSDSPVVPAKDTEVSGPVLLITLLLTSGARHPFKLDSKYLAKRNVEIPEGDPFNLSVYKLKELILREWRDEWEAKPTSPNYIRLISFGKLLDDKAALKGMHTLTSSVSTHLTLT